MSSRANCSARSFVRVTSGVARTAPAYAMRIWLASICSSGSFDSRTRTMAGGVPPFLALMSDPAEIFSCADIENDIRIALREVFHGINRIHELPFLLLLCAQHLREHNPAVLDHAVSCIRLSERHLAHEDGSLGRAGPEIRHVLWKFLLKECRLCTVESSERCSQIFTHCLERLSGERDPLVRGVRKLAHFFNICFIF